MKAMCSRLSPEHGSQINNRGIQIIRASLKRFNTAGILQDDHLKLIEEHLDLYPLVVMDFSQEGYHG